MSSLIHTIQTWFGDAHLPVLLIVGAMVLAGFYLGKTTKHLRLPSIIGFMVVGVLLGPSVLNLVDDAMQNNLSFVTDVALGFVALSIGLELSFGVLKRLGMGMVVIILAESLLAFVVVTAGLYVLTGNMPLALIFGAIAPASAPAGTVAVIQEYRASGNLTKALYAVVGFDDGLGIIIFGFASAIARSILAAQAGSAAEGLWHLVAGPLQEIGLSLLIGIGVAVLYCLLTRLLSTRTDLFILTFAAVLITIGICSMLHLSLILTNLIVGLVAANTQKDTLVEKIRHELAEVMPLLFVLFFVLAGAHLHISALPALGLVGVVYILSRSAGLMGGAWIGAVIGRLEPKIRKYLGMGILSQAGVAIGLALIVKQEFSELSSSGAAIGMSVITTVTATSIVFEIVGPILTKVGLRRAGEIPHVQEKG